MKKIILLLIWMFTLNLAYAAPNFQILNNTNSVIYSGIYQGSLGDVKLTDDLDEVLQGKAKTGFVDVNKPVNFAVAFYQPKQNQPISLFSITFRRPKNEYESTTFYLEATKDGKLVPQVGKKSGVFNKKMVTKVGDFSLEKNVKQNEISDIPKMIKYNYEPKQDADKNFELYNRSDKYISYVIGAKDDIYLTKNLASQIKELAPGKRSEKMKIDTSKQGLFAAYKPKKDLVSGQSLIKYIFPAGKAVFVQAKKNGGYKLIPQEDLGLYKTSRNITPKEITEKAVSYNPSI